MKTDVAIVIVSYNSEDHIGACLRSVFAQRKAVTQQVIVVDNDSRDGTVAFIRENFPQRYALKERDGILNPDHIAENYWMLHKQPRDAWTFELDLRPWIENW